MLATTVIVAAAAAPGTRTDSQLALLSERLLASLPSEYSNASSVVGSQDSSTATPQPLEYTFHADTSNASSVVGRQEDSSTATPHPLEYTFFADTDEARSLYRGCQRSVSDDEVSGTLPGMVMIGAQKAGTSSFELSTHSVFCSADEHNYGEVHFFDDEQFARHPVVWDGGPNAGLSTYLQQWAHCDAAGPDTFGAGYEGDPNLPRFEKTPGYATTPWTALRLCEALGAPTLAMILREPVSRAYSSFYQSRQDMSDFFEQTPEGFHTLATLEVGLVERCGGLYDGDPVTDAAAGAAFATCCAAVASEHGFSDWPGCGCSLRESGKVADPLEAAKSNKLGLHGFGLHFGCGFYGDKNYMEVRNSVYVSQVRAYLRYHQPAKLLFAVDATVYAHFPEVAKELADRADPPELTRNRAWRNQHANLTLEQSPNKLDNLQKRTGQKQNHDADGSYAPMLPETAKLLHDFYRPFNKELYALLGRDLGFDAD